MKPKAEFYTLQIKDHAKKPFKFFGRQPSLDMQVKHLNFACQTSVFKFSIYITFVCFSTFLSSQAINSNDNKVRVIFTNRETVHCVTHTVLSETLKAVGSES